MHMVIQILSAGKEKPLRLVIQILDTCLGAKQLENDLPFLEHFAESRCGLLLSASGTKNN